MTNRLLPEIAALAYIGIQSDKSGDWNSFATSLLGMQGIDKGGQLRTYRMDDRAQRLIVDGAIETPGFFGWEVVYRRQLDDIAARVEAAGYNVHVGTTSLKQQRMVADLIWFYDPSGYRIEVCWNPVVLDDPFIPGRPISGFKTGPLGMGHIVLHATNFDETLKFYRDILRFGVSDFFTAPYAVYFMHVNNRHHSMALAGTGRQGIHHFMVELQQLDDVGQGYDLAGLEDDRVAYTLGRHSNDWMTSYYSQTPNDFFVEYGWGAREVDPMTWQSEELQDGPSYWGHERIYMDEADAKGPRAMRLAAAEKGLRAGDPLNCIWASSLIAKTENA